MNDLRNHYDCIIKALKLSECNVTDVVTNGSFGSCYTTFEDPLGRNVRVVLDLKENWIVCESRREGAWFDLLPPLRGGALNFEKIRKAIGLPLIDPRS